MMIEIFNFLLAYSCLISWSLYWTAAASMPALSGRGCSPIGRGVPRPDLLFAISKILYLFFILNTISILLFQH